MLRGARRFPSVWHLLVGAQRWHRCGDPWGHGAGRAPCQPAPPASARSICDIRRCSSDRERFEAAPNAFLIPAYRRSLSELLSQPLCSALTATAQLQSRENLSTSPCPTEGEAPTTAAPCLALSHSLDLLALVGMNSGPCQALMASLGRRPCAPSLPQA